MTERLVVIVLTGILAVSALLALLRTAAWQERLAGLPGYAPMQSGEVLSMSRVLPWWRFGGRGKAGA